jgi:hypothetical protein
MGANELHIKIAHIFPFAVGRWCRFLANFLANWLSSVITRGH